MESTDVTATKQAKVDEEGKGPKMANDEDKGSQNIDGTILGIHLESILKKE